MLVPLHVDKVGIDILDTDALTPMAQKIYGSSCSVFVLTTSHMTVLPLRAHSRAQHCISTEVTFAFPLRRIVTTLATRASAALELRPGAGSAVLYIPCVDFFTRGTQCPDPVAGLIHGYRYLYDRFVLTQGILTIGLHTTASFIDDEVRVSIQH